MVYDNMNRVKSLSKSGNAKKDQGPASKESLSAAASSVPVDPEDLNDQNQEVKTADTGGRVAEKAYNSSTDFDGRPYSLPAPNYTFNGRDENGATSGYMDKEKADTKNNFGGSTGLRSSFSVQNSSDTLEDEKVQKVSPPRRKVTREEKPEKQSNWSKKDVGSNMTTTSYKQQNMYDSNFNNVAAKPYESEPPSHDGEINAVLEVGSIVNL